MTLKNIFRGTDNKIKKRVSAIMAGVIALTTIGSVTYFKEKKVQAKETLYSIEKILSDLDSSKSSFDILEIVPDTVSGNVTVKSASGNDIDVQIDQHMGFLGYYTGGSEPVRKDVDQVVNSALTLSANGSTFRATLSESTLRYGVVNAIYDALKQSDVYDEDSGPFSLADGYAEVRSGEDFENIGWVRTEDRFKSMVAGKALMPIERYNEDGLTINKDYVDTAKGSMEPAEYGMANANYIAEYYIPEGKDDIAYAFVDSYLSENRADPEKKEFENDNFSLTFAPDREGGSFDPNFVLPSTVETTENSVSANVWASFEAITDADGNKINVKSGYKAAGTPIEEATGLTDDTPVYTWDSVRSVYVYAGRYADAVSSNTVSDNSGVTNNEGSDNAIPETDAHLSPDEGMIEETDNGTSGEKGLRPASIEVETLREEPVNDKGYKNVELTERNRTILVKPAYTSRSESGYADTLNEIEDTLATDDLSDESIVEEELEEEEIISEEPEPLTEEPVEDDPLLSEDLTDIVDDRNSAVISSEDVNAADDGGYYVVTFVYTEMDNTSAVVSGTDSGMYYIKEFHAADENTGAQYILADDSDAYGAVVPNLFNRGIITVKADCDRGHFIYVYSKYEGNSKWLGDEANGSVYRIKGDRIYYRYGIENREWLKRFVFDRDCYPYDVNNETADTGRKLQLNVEAMTASEVTQYDIAEKSNGAYKYRLIALMAGDSSFCVAGRMSSMAGFTQYSAGTEHDISPYVYTEIINRVAKYNTPVIVDHKIISDEARLFTNTGDSLAYNLAYALMLSDVTGYDSLVYGMEDDFSSGSMFGTVYSPFDYVSYNNIAIISDNNYHYVNKSIYIYNRKQDSIGTGIGIGLGQDPEPQNLNVLNLTFDSKFPSGEVDAGFSEVALEIANDKMYREADYSLKDKPLTHDWVSEATAIRYIIGYRTARVAEGKGEVHVLELQPVNCFDLTTNNNPDVKDDAEFLKLYPKGSDAYNKLLTKDENGNDVIYGGELYYKDKPEKERTLIKQYGLKINLTQMTTAEFIGHIEDINAEYDLIYIGMNTGGKSVGVEKYVVDVQASIEANPVWHTPNWTQDKNAAKWNGKNWVEIGRSQRNILYEATEGEYYYRGWRSIYGDPWWNDNYSYYVEQYRIIPEQGHYETNYNVEETYGGYHHRISTQNDVNKGLAKETGVLITDFNDDNMDGLVYCNVGDMTYMGDATGGSLKIRTGGTDEAPEYEYLETRDGKKDGYGKAWDYMKITNDPNLGYSKDENGNTIRKSNGDYNYSLYRTRYNGNDITKEKCEALKDFARAGYPVILADGFYSSYDNSTRKGSINECTVDNSSYMYEAAKFLIDEYSDKNIFKQSYTPANVFNWYVLNLGKPTIEMTDERSRTSQESTVYMGESDKSGDGHYYAYYRFKIDNKGSASVTAKYTVGLYIDINADGKYSPTNEGVMFSELKDYSENNTPVPKAGVDENGMTVYELVSGHEYEARCKLSGSFVGCLPWRLKVSQIGNPYRRTNASGYYAVRNNEKVVNILQLKADGNNWDMAEDYGNHNSTFYRLITDTEYVPFTVNIKSMTKRQLTGLSSITDKTAEGYYEYFKNNYNMLVLGYNDMYDSMDGNDGEIIANAIKKYINEGYSVLFTHDCTSFVNNSRHQARSQDGWTTYNMLGDDWGYQFNTVIRNVVGMDRYDVMDESTHENEKPYKPRSNRRLVLDLESHGFTYHILNHWGYQSFESVGADGVWNQYQGGGYNDHFDNIFRYSNLYGASLGGGQYSSTYISEVNKGQITQYPYVLKDNFSVSQTHSQYYQLDLTADDDHDGESDIVVWYCISNTNANKENTYNVSPRDVRNNYYIYNKGNVTYSGVGHSKVTGEEEMKLFINTMIAAYRTGLHAPDLAIVDSYNTNAKKARSLYVSYDDQIQKMVSHNAAHPSDPEDTTGLNENSDIDDYVDLYFSADQVSLVQNASAIDHNLYAKVFIEDPASTESLEFKPDDVTGNYYYDSASNSYYKGTYKRIGENYVEVSSTEDGDYAKIGGNYNKCNYRQIREFEETAVDTAKTKVTALPLASTPGDGYITREDGAAVEIMDAAKIDDTFKRENFTSESEYNKFAAKRDHIVGCAKIENGVTYKVRIPVTDDNIWGGKLKSGTDLENIRAVYVAVMDFASYRNNQESTDTDNTDDSTSTGDSTDIVTTSAGAKKGKIYKVDMTKWKADKVDISRVEVFNLD